MKNSKLRRALLLLACAVMLVSLSVGATLAYLTSTDEVKNTFTVGDVQIKLDEAALLDYNETTNEYAPNNDVARVQENKYKIVPGVKMAKDPTVTVLADSEDCYVRAIVTVIYREAADTVVPQNFFTTWVQGYDQTKWIPYADGAKVEKYEVTVGEDEAAVTTKMVKRTYELRYYQEVVQQDTDNALTPIFTAIHMPTEMTNDQIAALADLEINIVAHAIQADGFETADLAWKAWK